MLEGEAYSDVIYCRSIPGLLSKSELQCLATIQSAKCTENAPSEKNQLPLKLHQRTFTLPLWQFHHSEFIPVQSYPYFSPEDGCLHHCAIFLHQKQGPQTLNCLGR